MLIENLERILGTSVIPQVAPATASLTPTADLRDLSARFEQSPPQDILEWGVKTFGEKLVVVTSFQPTGIVTLHMLSEIAPGTPVLTLDTGLLFPETYALMDEIEARLNLQLIRVRPEQSVEAQNAAHGAALWENNPDQCCNLRKVQPLEQTLTEYDAWITGIRRDQSPQRAAAPIVSWDKRHQNVKLSPFATWDERMIWIYIKAHELPYNALHDQNYPSIGCWPCTKAVDASADGLRGGRWTNHVKSECGIHLGSL